MSGEEAKNEAKRGGENRRRRGGEEKGRRGGEGWRGREEKGVELVWLLG